MCAHSRLRNLEFGSLTQFCRRGTVVMLVVVIAANLVQMCGKCGSSSSSSLIKCEGMWKSLWCQQSQGCDGRELANALADAAVRKCNLAMKCGVCMEEKDFHYSFMQ